MTLNYFVTIWPGALLKSSKGSGCVSHIHTQSWSPPVWLFLSQSETSQAMKFEVDATWRAWDQSWLLWCLDPSVGLTVECRCEVYIGRKHSTKRDVEFRSFYSSRDAHLDKSDKPPWPSEEIWISLHRLRIVVTPVRSVCVTSKAHFFNWFPSRVHLDPVLNRLLPLRKSYIAVLPFFGTDSPQFPTSDRYCWSFVLRRKDFMDPHMYHSTTPRECFNCLETIQVELSDQIKAIETFDIDNCPSLLVILRLVMKIIGWSIFGRRKTTNGSPSATRHYYNRKSRLW